VVREDLLAKGLLYAGTETGMFVSFDDGDHWQSLQLNLPFTSVRDLALHGDDVIAATYGRSLWILDNLAPLRQVNRQTSTADAYLFQPPHAVRFPAGAGETPLPPDTPAAANPPAGAALDYYLRTPATVVTLEILDRADQVVSKYSSDANLPAPEAPANVTDEWVRRVETLPTAAGMHRVFWDLRKAPVPGQLQGQGRQQTAPQASGTRPLTVSAYMQGNPTWPPGAVDVEPGQYSVRLTVDGKVFTQPLMVESLSR
jgi:hypothetical protein